MSNGDTDFKHLNNESKRQLRLVTNHGRLVTSSSSRSAKRAQQLMAGRTSSLSEHCPYQKRLSKREERRLQRRAKTFYNYSSEELAMMDKQGIKILGVEFEYDYFDRSWAE